MFPIFIAAILASFGFTNHVDSKTGELFQFDLCFNYISTGEFYNPQNFELQNTKHNVKEDSFSFSGFNSSSPDSIDETTDFEAPDTLLVKMSRADSIIYKAKQDSIKRIDSLSADSTARIKHFRVSREDNPVVQFRPKRKSSFFVYPSDAWLKRTVQLDSTGNKVIIKEEIGGQLAKTYIEIPIEEYIELRLQSASRDALEQLAYKYELKSDKKDLSQLITDITNIEIPLPSSSIFNIFGPPKINLKIAGAVDIHGAWRNEKTEGVTTSALGNTRNEPDFKQQVQINLNGTIGDKLVISADWNTERTFQYENQLKIKYTGYEDEIVQSVEAGNVSLQTSPLVGGSEALFGVKSQFKMGPFTLTALASQKKGEVQEVSVSGGAKAQQYEIRAYNYSKNHYFIHEIYADPVLNVFNRFYGSPVPQVIDSLRVKDIEVWKSTTGLPNPNERKGNAFIDLPSRKLNERSKYNSYRNVTEPVPGSIAVGERWVLLQAGVDYDIHNETGFITFRTNIQEQDQIAVAYRKGGIGGDDYFGEFIQEVGSDTTATLILKLVKPRNLQPQFQKAWKLQLRNIYPVGGRQIKEEGFTLDIKYQVEGGEPRSDYNGIKLLEVFGLDKTDKSGTSNQPDGAFDFFPPRTVMPETGEIIFPVLEPFGKNIPNELRDLQYQQVYDTTSNFASQDRAKDKFIITGEYSAAISSSFSIGFNVVENSVRVLLNGNQLVAGVDYTVDYNIGQVIIRKQEALVPGADLRITYEQNDLFQMASKTLLGLRGLYEINRQTSLGFSYLNLNQQTLSDKVRIGEEPLNNSILGLDFSTKIDLPFITKALDNVISTSAPSSLDIRAEYAYMNPDPNTKKSTISSDGGRSIAYVDDFEGTKRIIPLGLTYGSWKDISVPANLPYVGANFDENVLLRNKAKAYWFNYIPANVSIRELYGDRKQAGPDQQMITALDFVYDPKQRGFYNYDHDLSDTTKNWAGIMKGLSSTANNLIEENIEFVEFWMKIVNAPEGVNLNIDIGLINEDVIPNGSLDTEDKNNNGLVDEGEDTGIDGMTDDQEKSFYNSTDPDPANDNYSFNYSSGDYSRVNGTQGNAVSTDLGRIPDTEDLNGNYTLDRINSYFSIPVKIDTNRITNEYIQGGGSESGWYLYRVPLKDFKKGAGNPSLSVVETIRFWVSGASSPIHLRFTEMNLVGNQWQKVLDDPKSGKPNPVTIDDKVLTVSVVNVEDNPEYTAPPGVFRERDRTQPDYEIFKNEQALALILQDLKDGDKREVVRYLFKPLDVFSYKEMKLFIHGDKNDLSPSSVSYYKDSTDYSSEVFLRFGTDSANYYEYRQPVRADWNEVSMVFSQLTAIKQRRDSTQIAGEFRVPVEGKEGHSYGVRGQPTLTRITFFNIGIVNPAGKGTGESVSGSIWLNELRVLEADATPGWAYSVNSTLQFADMLKVNFNINQTDPNFHKLAERFGSREDRLNWGVAVDLDIVKLIPFNIPGSTMNLSYSRNEQATNPVYRPGTDIKVEEAQSEVRKVLEEKEVDPVVIEETVSRIKEETQTVNVSETWSLSNMRIKIPTEKWYIRDIINNLSLGFNYNKTSGRNPAVLLSKSWIWNANANYSTNFSRDLFFKPLDIPYIGDLLEIFTDYKDVKIYFAPQSISGSLISSRRRSFTQNRTISTKPNIQRDFTATRGAGFNWVFTEGGLLNLSLSYDFSIQSSLAYLLTIDEVERSESDIWRDIFNGNLFGKDFMYRQNFDLRANPKLPSIWDLNRYININTSYNVAYSWQNNFQQETLGRSAGYSNRISLGTTVRVKSIFAPLFEESKPTVQAPKPTQPQQPQQREGGRGGRRSQRGAAEERQTTDSLAQTIPDTLIFSDSLNQQLALLDEDSLDAVDEDKPGILSVSLEYLKLGAKWLLFDYDQISINFSQTSSFTGSGLAGEGTGFNNFWGAKQSSSKGPSRLFMLGLSNDVGPRAINGNLSDNYSQKNDLDFKTSRPLWQGAQLDLAWKVGWGLNKTSTLQSDSLGRVSITNLTSTTTIDRSFLALPMLGSGIVAVSEKYDKTSPEPNANLSQAFREGFETISFLSKIPILSELGKYIPRPNWSLNWTGLEQYPFLNFAKRIAIQHAYTSTYSEGLKINPDGIQEVQSQRIEYGFNPLLGVTMQFDNVLSGTLQAIIRYSTRTSYGLGVSTRNITEAFSRDVSVSASYARSGFEFPLFGLALKNDLEISFSYTNGKSSSIIFDMDNFTEAGIPQEGKTNTVIEPKIKYVMSSRVTLSIFYRRTSIEPEGASRIPPLTTNEAGVDVHITIQ